MISREKRIIHQKKRHFVKPFIIYTTPGFVLDVYGLYEATLNDAAILLNILEKDYNLRALIKKDDVFIVDRGFRDCVNILEKNYNLKVRIHLFKYKNL